MEKKKHKLIELFGILSKEEGDAMLKDLEEQRAFDTKASEKRHKELMKMFDGMKEE